MDWLTSPDWNDLRTIAWWFVAICVGNLLLEAFLLWRRGQHPFKSQLAKMPALLPLLPFLIILLAMAPMHNMLERRGVDGWVFGLISFALPNAVLALYIFAGWRSRRNTSLKDD